MHGLKQSYLYSTHNIVTVVYRAEEPFQAAQAAAAAGEEEPENVLYEEVFEKHNKPSTVIVEIFDLPLNIFKDNSDHPHNSQDQRSESQSSKMKNSHLAHSSCQP